MLARAVEAGIDRILVPGYDVPSSMRAVELAARQPDPLDAAVGIHPHYAGSATEADWRELGELARQRGVVAIGEIGLDFHRNLSTPDEQRDALRRQLDLAGDLALPVLVHDREAHVEVTDTLVAWEGPDGGRARGVIHCFSGDEHMALTLAAAGYLISFALPVTFSSARGQRAAAASVPSESLLTETDSPWLAAGDRRNEPTTVLRIAAELARLRATTVEAVAVETRAAYRRLTGR